MSFVNLIKCCRYLLADKKIGTILDWLNKYPCNYEPGELQNMIDELNTAPAPFEEETQDALNQMIGSRTSSFSSSGSIRNERKSLLKMFEIVSEITIDSHPNNIRVMNKNELVSINYTLNDIKFKMMKLTNDLESNEFQLSVEKPQYVPTDADANRSHIPVALKKSISRLSSMFSDLDMSLKVEQLSEEDRGYFLKALTEQINSITRVRETIEAEINN